MARIFCAAVFSLAALMSQSSAISRNFTRVKYPEPEKILQDDILLPPNSHEEERTKLIETDVPSLWPNGVVYYVFEESEVDEYHRNLVRAALRTMEQYSCVRFKESSAHGPHLRVRNIGEGCASVIGYQRDEQSQDLYLSGEACYTQGSIQHEFLHSLGFGHEHTRPDRDSYVNIQWSNIVPGAEINFTKRRVRWVTDLLPYDYQSVMHYRPDAFKRDISSLTVVPRQPGAIALIGQRIQLSRLDVEKLNLLYGCYKYAAIPQTF
ncbi:seminal metalloprotease 1-like isoform X1 [Bemisia tabaci]